MCAGYRGGGHVVDVVVFSNRCVVGIHSSEEKVRTEQTTMLYSYTACVYVLTRYLASNSQEHISFVSSPRGLWTEIAKRVFALEKTKNRYELTLLLWTHDCDATTIN